MTDPIVIVMAALYKAYGGVAALAGLDLLPAERKVSELSRGMRTELHSCWRFAAAPSC